jgi:hypothetical protein
MDNRRLGDDRGGKWLWYRYHSNIAALFNTEWTGQWSHTRGTGHGLVQQSVASKRLLTLDSGLGLQQHSVHMDLLLCSPRS